jgi:hypothetical protein
MSYQAETKLHAALLRTMSDILTVDEVERLRVRRTGRAARLLSSRTCAACVGSMLALRVSGWRA